ncbi:hypothetical protein BDV40DRAFT_254132 [Aspergillus tamarii]|uniref:GPI anchored protein n=1 Tax=Aspergillus tamarii TaxID=41984 RepID=A0A5N6V842_ASPTM|nr:hypothetical protein BDV40DRAFT_254132 [Aspergillus tamarii]
MKGLQNGIPIAMLAAMASAQGFGGGPRVDTGNGVGMGFSNEFSSEVNNVNKDDHATNVHSETNILKAPPHPPHGGQHGPPHGGHDGHDEGARHQPRAGPPGSDGVDVGTAAQWNSVNKATHEVHSANVDDHHVDINEKHTVTVLHPPPKHHTHGGEHEGYGEEHEQGHKQGEGARGHGKRWDPFGEEGAVDTGNSANYDFENKFHSTTNNANVDNHKVDVNEKTNIVTPPAHPHGHGGNGGHGPEHERRDEREPHGGPKRIDTANDVDFTFSNDFDDEVNSYNEDNHGVDVKKNTNIQVAPPHGDHPHGHEGQEGHHKRAYRPDADSAFDPSRVDTGDAFESEAFNSGDAKTNSANVDDHSMSINYDVNETVARPHGGHHHDGHEQPAEHHEKEPSKPAEHHQEEHAEPVPTCTTLTRQVVHTVVRTVQAHSEPTHAPQHQEQVNTPTAQPEQPKDHQGSDHDDHSEVKSPKPTGDDGSHQEQAHGPASTPAHEQAQPTGADGSHEGAHSTYAHGPASTPAYEQAQPTGVDGSHRGEDSSSHEGAHGPASTPAYEQAQPTGVDGSHRGEDSSSHEGAHGPASTPAHEQAQPTGVDGSHRGDDSSSHEGAHGPASTPAHKQPHPTGADGSHRGEDCPSYEGAHSTNAHGPASTPAHEQPQHGGDHDSHFDVPSSTTLAHIAMTTSPTHSPSYEHGVLTSTQTVYPSSSLHHVYVQQSSSSAAHVSQTPAATPSAHVPVGVDAEHSSHVANGHATPSPSSHDVMFTGAAANLSPSAGVISLACGVIGLLAYVL